jgi:hypothetical protein
MNSQVEAGLWRNGASAAMFYQFRRSLELLNFCTNRGMSTPYPVTKIGGIFEAGYHSLRWNASEAFFKHGTRLAEMG